MKSQKNVIYNQNLGLLLQIPVFLISAFGILSALYIIALSFTDLGGETLKFAGFQNYATLFTDSKTSLAFSNTRVFLFTSTLFLSLFAVIPALFTARLKLPFGIIMMGTYSLTALSSCAVSYWNFMFASCEHSYANSMLIQKGIIEQPFPWIFYDGGPLLTIILTLVCAAPIFAITYIFARLKNKHIAFTVGLCAIPVLAVAVRHLGTSFLMSPFSNDSIIWLPDVISNNLNVTGNKGQAFAIITVLIIAFLLWVILVCGVSFGISKLYRLIKINRTVKNVFGYISFAVCCLCSLLFAFEIPITVVSGALKPLSETHVFPAQMLPMNPTISNFVSVIKIYFDYFPSISETVINLGVLLLVFLFAILPFSYSFAKFKMFKNQELLLLTLIPLAMFLPDFHTFENSTISTLYGFFSGAGFILLVFLSYIVIKMLIAPLGRKKKKTSLGILSLISSFFAVALTTINFGSNNSWYTLHSTLSKAKILTDGTYFAGEYLLGSFTVMSFILPAVLLLVISLIHRNDIKKGKILNEIQQP